MRFQNITKDDMKNGDGLRVVLWVSGCSHHCPGCQNPITWDPDDGIIWEWGPCLDEIDEELRKDYISGLTISGGDPFYKGNILTVLGICRHVKEEFPEKTIWIYTGYTFEYLMSCLDFPASDMFGYIDVLVDGEFEKDLLDVNYPWAGSTNQRVIDVKKSLQEGKVVLYGNNQEGRNAGSVQTAENCGCDS